MYKNFFQNLNYFFYHIALFIFMFLIIQNSDHKQNLYFLKYESVPIPVSFIVGSSFICGSLYSNILISLISKKD